MLHRVSCTILIAALSGCASAPAPKYYTVDMHPARTAALARNIEIDRISMSQALGRPEILIQTSPTTVEYYAADQWVTGISELVGQKLRAEFGEIELGRETFVLRGDVLGFGQIDTPAGADAFVKLDVEIRTNEARRSDTPTLRKTYERTVDARSAEPGAVVEALSRALETVAAEIVSDVNGLAAK